MNKAITTLLLLGVIGYSAFIIYERSIGPCGRPIEYSIGTFDTNFGVSKDVFMKDIVAGESVWENAVAPSKIFFKYNPTAKFKINLIYDERQKTIIEKQKSEYGLSATESSFKAIDAQFNNFKTSYESKSSAYEQALASFKKESAQYEADVEYWNQRGGAPKAEYNKLSSTQTYLNNKIKDLNKQVEELNKMNADLNALLDQRNIAAKKYNELVASYNKKFGTGLEFDQAEYTGDAINVYEFKNNTDLTLALAHELGHALGLDHVENPKSIMYYLTGEQTGSLTPEDLVELKTVCGFK